MNAAAHVSWQWMLLASLLPAAMVAAVVILHRWQREIFRRERGIQAPGFPIEARPRDNRPDSKADAGEPP